MDPSILGWPYHAVTNGTRIALRYIDELAILIQGDCFFQIMSVHLKCLDTPGIDEHHACAGPTCIPHDIELLLVRDHLERTGGMRLCYARERER
jgi:hypothetical protein